MEAIILAGGYGTRLAHIVADVPKPMAPVAGKPFLEYIVEGLIAQKIERIILAVGYKKESITDYFGDRYRGVPLEYSTEDSPLLTGGAMKKALNYCSGNDVFIVNGDTIFDVDLRQMENVHKKNRALLTIAVKPEKNSSRYGTVRSNENGRVEEFREKGQSQTGDINGGLYLLKRSALETQPAAFSFEKDFMEKNAVRLPFYVYRSSGYFIDIGIPEDFYKAQEDFTHAK